jgi:hypothetical protein
MKGKAIVVKNLNDVQLHILVNYLSTNHYKWKNSILDKESIARGEVLYMDNDKGLSYSNMNTFERYEKNNYTHVSFNELTQMKKSDLKPGMVVEYANGKKRLVVSINGELALIGENMFSELHMFNEDLTNKGPSLNIVRIFQPKEAASLNTLLQCDNCIWVRSEEIVLTMQEIADKFGVPVEQLKIKK